MNSNLPWGSDRIAEMLPALGLDYIALTPGSSFRGFHDSVVNHLGNDTLGLILAIHEESAVAIAHGYAKAAGKPMAVALHSNVGLMHATMAIFNAWCDRVPMMILGAVGPMDAARRRPWVDWVHTATDLAALIRPYTKWDNQPYSIPAALEALVRAHQIARTAPQGPVYVCLDQTLQEARLTEPAPLPNLARFPQPIAPEPAPPAVRQICEQIGRATRPLFLFGRVSAEAADWERRVALAERCNAAVLTDLKVGARFPTRHPLHLTPPGLSATPEALALMRQADLIVSFDWIDLGGTLMLATSGAPPQAFVANCSLDQYSHNGWGMDHLTLPQADLALLADPDRLVAALLDQASSREGTPNFTVPAAAGSASESASLGVEALARTVTDTLAGERPCYARLPIGWPGAACDFTEALSYLGYDGAGGIGSGPGMAVGAALALRDSGRLPVAVLGDGDFLMGVSGLWTAVHHRLPLLVIVANNRSFFNDEIHQEKMARERGRPIENRGVGIQIDDPPPDLATLARGQGAQGWGPVHDEASLRQSLTDAVAHVKAGGVALIDVHVTREYGRGIPAAVLAETKASN